jgi:hypothetical protein
MSTVSDRDRRLGRAVLFVHQQDGLADPLVRAELETLFLAGRAMDFAARLREHGQHLTTARAVGYAKLAGIGVGELGIRVLPVLKAAGVVDFAIRDRKLIWIEEYVGLSAPVIAQTLAVLEALGPSEAERAVLHSVEIASWAPLTEAQHLEQLAGRGFVDHMATKGLSLAKAAGVNKRVYSSELREDVVFNPYVWGSNQVPIARFLHSLPPAERDALLGICEQASDRPGLALPALAGSSPALVASARKVGLIQAATVKSSANPIASQTYVFSPLLEGEDNLLVTTEALHQRKLFVAHILFGHEKALAGRGVVRNPVVLVEALLRKGWVGPATNIESDYHLLEAAGIVQVEEVSGGRALLKLVKREIVEGGLGWLHQTVGGDEGGAVPKLLRAPGDFVTPERDRANLPDDAAAAELTRAAVLRLREEVQRATRLDSPLA